MKKYIIFLIVIAAFSCSDFDDTNVDPNNPTKVPIAGFLTEAINDMPVYENGLTGLYYSQYWSATRYTSESRYEITQFDYTSIYSGALNNLEKVIAFNENEESKQFASESGSNANQIAVANIIQSYFFIHASDRWGDLPYAEALHGNENITPAYDTQQSLYEAVFEQLKQATNQFDGGDEPTGDILYNGSVDKWKKFANSLRVKMALRISKVAPEKAKAEFEAAIANGIFTSNEDNAIYHYLGNGVFDNPWYNDFLTRTDYAVSKPLVDKLINLDDPRLVTYADPINPGEANTYAGMPYGLGNSEAAEYGFDQISLPHSEMAIAKDASIPILTYSQILFYLAEGASNGWDAMGTAKEHYENAIKASMEQWGVFEQSTYDNYITQPEVAFNPSQLQEQLGNQKWIATYMQGYEAWAEWRRLGYPLLMPAPAAMNNSGEIPRRQGYPASEAQNNAANYEVAVARQGPDNLDTRMWWDAN